MGFVESTPAVMGGAGRGGGTDEDNKVIGAAYVEGIDG